MKDMWGRIREILRKELLQVLRDPRMRFVLIVPPVVQLIIFGFAVNLDVEHARIAWMDMDRTPASRDLQSYFSGSQNFDITHFPTTEDEVRDLLDRGEVQAIIRVLPGFARDVSRGTPTSVQILVDGSNSNTASIISSYATQVISAYAQKVQAAQSRSATTASPAPAVPHVPVLVADTRVWFNPELLSRNYFVPGIIVNVIALVTLMLTAMAIVREKEIGTMEQLMVTPIRPIELLIGKTLPFAAIGLLDLILVTSAALLIFRIPFRGSALLLLGCAILFLLTSLGVGLFISTVSQTQQQAMMGSFFFFQPAFMLSGFAFPIRNMPVAIQYLSYLDPLRYFVEIVRGIFLKGTGIAALWPQILALSVFGLIIMGMSALRFHKRLD